MKSPAKKTTWKKVFLNVTVALLAIAYTGNVIAVENAGQINSFLGISTSRTVYTGTGDPNEYIRYYESNYRSIADLKETGLAKVREVEGEGAVLLKNDNNTLPLKGSDVSLFGATAISPVYGGTGSGAVSSADAPTYLQVLTEGGFNVVNSALLDWYRAEELGRDFSRGDINEASWKKIQGSNAVETFGVGENAIFVMGRVGGEANDLKSVDHNDGLNGDYLALNKQEAQILEGLKALKDEGRIASITVLINSATVIAYTLGAVAEAARTRAFAAGASPALCPGVPTAFPSWFASISPFASPGAAVSCPPCAFPPAWAAICRAIPVPFCASTIVANCIICPIIICTCSYSVPFLATRCRTLSIPSKSIISSAASA